MLVKWLLYAVLLVCSLAMLCLLLGFALWQLDWAWLAGQAYHLAGELMLAGFLLLFILGCGLCLRALYQDFALYWQRETRLSRRISMLKTRKHHHSQRRRLERQQIQYRQELQRQRLLMANDKKHSRLLYRAICQELRAHLSAERYQLLQADLKRYDRQADLQSMLALRERVLCQSSHAG